MAALRASCSASAARYGTGRKSWRHSGKSPANPIPSSHAGHLLAARIGLIKWCSPNGEGPMKFDMSEAWREAMAMITANREVLLIVAGIFFLLPSVALGLSIGELQESMLADPQNAERSCTSSMPAGGGCC
jgi:hypothetical protein